MDLKNVKTFICVAELGSFTRAAERLGFSQSTVSFQVKQLESELGVRLFERIHHTVNLTEQGREVLRYAHRLDKLTKELDNDLRADKEMVGHIRLAMADSLCDRLERAFHGFWQRYPGISLKIISAGTEEMFRLLNHNEVDLVLTLDNRIYDRSYVILREERVGTHFVAAAGHPLAGKQRLSVQEVVRQPFLLTERGMSYRRLLDEKLAASALEVSPLLETGNVETICRLVEQGDGCSFLPDYATEPAVAAGRLARLAVEDFTVEVWKQLFCHRDKWISPQMQAVIDCCAAI
nr:LysR family transcriptional regulator [uncultured Dysosmobacter sp.]